MRILPYDPKHNMQLVVAGGHNTHESKYAKFGYDPVAVLNFLRSINMDNLALWSAHTEDGGEGSKLVGYIFVSLQDCIFLPTKMCSVLGLYVMPAYRHTAAFPKLLRTAEKWAKSKGATFVIQGITGPIDPEPVAKVFRKLGYASWGILMRKEL